MRPRQESDFRFAPAFLAVFVIGFVAVLVLGYWGWSHVMGQQLPQDLEPVHHLLGRAYLTLQLFVLHPQGLPERDPWQLDAARFLAPVVLGAATIYLLSATFGKQMRHEWLRRQRKHVIVCGGGMHGRHLTKLLVERGTPVVLVDIDPRAAGMSGRMGWQESWLVANAVDAHTLRRAGAHSAKQLFALTGDDVVNARIASTVRDLSCAERHRPHPRVFVRAEDAALVPFLDQGAPADLSAKPSSATSARSGDLKVQAFGTSRLAAAALFGGGPILGTLGPYAKEAPLAALETAKDAHLLLAGDHGLLEAIVVTALRRWRAKRLRSLQQGSEASSLLSVTLVGSDAEGYREEIAKRWRLDPALIDLRALEVDARTEAAFVGSRSWNAVWNRVTCAVVACKEEQVSLAITLTLSRVLGPRADITRVSTQPTQSKNDLDNQLEIYSERSLSSKRTESYRIGVRSIADLAWTDNAEKMEYVMPSRRLTASLHAEGFEKGEAESMANQLLEKGDLALQFDAAPNIAPSDAAIVAGLLKAACGDGTSVSVSALVAAGLMPNLSKPANLRRAAEQLTGDRSRDAFSAWCEYTRLVAGDSAEAGGLLDLAAGDGSATAPLKLKAAALGRGEALALLEPDQAIVEELVARAPRRIAFFAGAAAQMSDEAAGVIGELLKRALHGYDGLIVTGGTDVGLCGAVRAAASANGVSVLGYAPEGRGLEGTWLRLTPPGDFSAAEPVAMWTDVLAARALCPAIPGTGEVQFVAFPGGTITWTEIALARSLGAEVAFLDPLLELADPLEEKLPFGAGGVLPLPTDPMTLRAFLTRPNEPEDQLEQKRYEIAAEELHNRYRREHVRHKPSDDPALVPWERLSPLLKDSNLAAAHDIPNKLHILGKRLCVGGARLSLSRAEIELLAEMEHGRYNYERLSAGWELGRSRQVTRMVTPYLKPWCELEERVKQWDRDAVRAIDNALLEAGWGVAAASPP